MSRVDRSRAAGGDLVDIVCRSIPRGSPEAARRFRAGAEATFRRLADRPGSGTRYDHDHAALAGLRFSPLSSPFGKFLVFYRPVTGGIEVVRVLHGARDVEAILAREFGIDEGVEDEEDGRTGGKGPP